MRTNRICKALPVALLAVATLQAATLYEQEGIALEGSVRIAARGVATCEVLEESHPPDAYERMKANHGRPLHVWRLDFSAYNGSGKPLAELTAHFKIASEWPPCTNWTGPEGTYPKPVQWASSFETLQRTDGLEGAGELDWLRNGGRGGVR